MKLLSNAIGSHLYGLHARKQVVVGIAVVADRRDVGSGTRGLLEDTPTSELAKGLV